MAKKDMFRMGTPEEVTASQARMEREREIYAMNMLQLQEKAGLTYKEARAFLIPYRDYTPWALADVFGIDVHAVYNLQRNAKKKIAASGYTLEEIYENYDPGEPQLVLVSHQ